MGHWSGPNSTRMAPLNARSAACDLSLSVHSHRRQIVLPGQRERQRPVLDQRQPLAIGPVNGIKRVAAVHLLAHLIGKIVGLHRANIDRPALDKLVKVIFGMHQSYPFLIVIVCTTVSGRVIDRSTCNNPFSIKASPTSTPSAQTNVR